MIENGLQRKAGAKLNITNLLSLLLVMEGGKERRLRESDQLYFTTSQQRELWTLVSLKPTAAQRLCVCVNKCVYSSVKYARLNHIVSQKMNDKRCQIKLNKHCLTHSHRTQLFCQKGLGEVGLSYLIALSAVMVEKCVKVDSLTTNLLPAPPIN